MMTLKAAHFCASKPRSSVARIRWPVEETGRNSVTPSTMPRMMAITRIGTSVGRRQVDSAAGELAAAFQWVERSPGDRLAEVADEHRLKFSLRGNDRQQRQLRHGRESVGEFVLRSEDQRRADDRGLAERLADRGLTVAFGATVIRRRARVGTDRRDVDK